MASSKTPECYFEPKSGGYYLRLRNGQFVQLGSSDLRLHLMHAGIGKQETKTFGITQADHFVYMTQTDKNVDYAGPLAGYRIGLHTLNDGSRALVTSEPFEVFDEPKESGEPKRIVEFFGDLFSENGAAVERLFLWLKVATESLRESTFQPGQVAVFAGPPGCGKSLAQELICRLLGGRKAKPYAFLAGKSQFNGELCGAENWVIEDEEASTDIRTRRSFGTGIKAATVNRSLSINAKGKQAVTVDLFRRPTISLNDEPENVAILPPMDASVSDKVMLFRCRKAELGNNPLPPLLKELPALRFWLSRMTVPKGLKDSRFGVVAYHDQSLLEMLVEISPEARLRSLIDEVIFAEPTNPKTVRRSTWHGSAEQLEKELRSSSFSFAVEKLLYYSTACGVFLGRLANLEPKRFSATKSKGRTNWRIVRPLDEE